MKVILTTSKSRPPYKNSLLISGPKSSMVCWTNLLWHSLKEERKGGHQEDRRREGAEKVGERVKEACGGSGGSTCGSWTTLEVIIRPLLFTWKILRLT